MTDVATVLVVDSDPARAEALRVALAADHDVRLAATAAAAKQLLESEWLQLVLCERGFRDDGGDLLLERIATSWPDVTRLVLDNGGDALADTERALAFQVLAPAWRPEDLRQSVSAAIEVFHLRRQNELMALELKVAAGGANGKSHNGKGMAADDDGIVRSGDSPMNDICERVRQVAPFDIPVLICGESGTGKELAARALHSNSLRWEQPFVVENCGALPDELLESELFGYRKGAFTGAVEDREGLFERANGGTVFLDEIGELSPAFQVKLLRVLQEQEIRPLGASETRKVDVRIVAATNRDLEDEVAAGRFREDLYYRLAAVTIRVPSLRERRSDIVPLANALLARAVAEMGKPCRGLSSEALACVQQYCWPGNVRELQNEIQRMLVECTGDVIGAELLSPRVLRGAQSDESPCIGCMVAGEGTLKARVQTIEMEILRESLVRHHWNKSRAARELGLSRVGLRSKLERYGLERVEDQDAATAV